MAIDRSNRNEVARSGIERKNFKRNRPRPSIARNKAVFVKSPQLIRLPAPHLAIDHLSRQIYTSNFERPPFERSLVHVANVYGQYRSSGIDEAKREIPAWLGTLFGKGTRGKKHGAWIVYVPRPHKGGKYFLIAYRDTHWDRGTIFHARTMPRILLSRFSAYYSLSFVTQFLV